MHEFWYKNISKEGFHPACSPLSLGNADHKQLLG